MSSDSPAVLVDAAVIVIALVGGLLAELVPILGMLFGLCGMGAVLVGMALVLSLAGGGFGVGSAGIIGFLLIAAAFGVLVAFFVAFASVFTVSLNNLVRPPPPPKPAPARDDEPFRRHGRSMRPAPARPDNFFHVLCPHCGTPAWPEWRTKLSSSLLPLRCFACLHLSGKKGVVLGLSSFLLLALPFQAHWGRLQLIVAAVAGIGLVGFCVNRPLRPVERGQIVRARAGLALAAGVWLTACVLLMR